MVIAGWFDTIITLFFIGMAVNGWINASVPHIEREFGFTSTETGLLLASNDLTGFLFVLIVSYYGETGRKPLWVGIGCIITGNFIKKDIWTFQYPRWLTTNLS